MTILAIILMLPVIFLASSFPLFILLGKFDEAGITGKVFGVLIGMFIVGGIILSYQLK